MEKVFLELLRFDFIINTKSIKDYELEILNFKH